MAGARGLPHDMQQELQRAGMWDIAGNIGYGMDALHATTAAGAATSSGVDLIASAGACAAAAQAELAATQKRLASVKRPGRASEATGPGAAALGGGSNSNASSITKQVQQGRKSARTSVEDSAGRSGPGGAAAKGLRHFAMQVCNKIEVKGRTTYNEVADELVEELKDDPSAGGDDKNIRRRVYDAFNVLLAVGIISKEGKKEIVWKGFPGSQALEQAQAERKRRLEAVEKKQQELQDLIEQNSMVRQLLEANPVRGPNETDLALQIPFVLVRAKPEATVEVCVSDSMEEVDFKFNAPFSLHDDTYVLKQMIQHYGSIRSSQQPERTSECAASS